MEKSELDSILLTAASNIKGYVREEYGNNETMQARAAGIMGSLKEIAHKLNENGSFDAIPGDIRINFIAQTVGNVATTALESGKDIDEVGLHERLAAAIDDSRTIKIAQERRSAGSGIQRGADGRRRIREQSDTSFDGMGTTTVD